MSSAFKVAPLSPHPELARLRQQIDEVDRDLISLLEKRASMVFLVGDYKRENQLPVHDPVREKKIKSRIRDLVSQQSSLSINEMESLFMLMVEKFRFLESAHSNKQSVLENVMLKTSIDFSRSQQVVIWGFGLLGASFYLALNESLPHWSYRIVDPYIEVDSFLKWKSENKLTNIELMNSDQMKNADLYILAGPVDVNAKHLREFNFPNKSLVFDLGSTKKTMSEIYETRQQHSTTDFTYVGGHPLAGRESSGFTNADPLLFYNKTFCWVTSNLQHLNSPLKMTFDSLAFYLGANPFWIEAAEHDEALAWTSHLPQILSSALANCLTEKKFSANGEVFPGVISQLLRISGSSLSIWQSIVETNQKQLQAALTELIQQLNETQTNLKSVEGCKKIFNQSNYFYRKFKKGV